MEVPPLAVVSTVRILHLAQSPIHTQAKFYPSLGGSQKQSDIRGSGRSREGYAQTSADGQSLMDQLNRDGDGHGEREV